MTTGLVVRSTSSLTILYNKTKGWSKFITNLYMESTKDNGVAIMSYAPSTLNAVLSNGNEVSITLDTDYPFGEVMFVFLFIIA